MSDCCDGMQRMVDDLRLENHGQWLEMVALTARIRGYAKEREATGGTIDSSRVAADLLRIVGDS